MKERNRKRLVWLHVEEATPPSRKPVKLSIWFQAVGALAFTYAVIATFLYNL